MKKFIVYILSVLIIFSLAACEGNTKSDPDKNPAQSSDKDVVNNSTLDNEESGAPDQPLPHSHIYSDATCTSPAECICGATDSPALGHAFTDGNCSRCGETDPDYVPLSASRKKALDRAKSCVKYMDFSYITLLNHLKTQGFSHEDALYAVDNCGADWNKEAANEASSQLFASELSPKGLYAYLVLADFTESQVEYALENCNADWNEQATKNVNTLLSLSMTGYSYQELFDILEYRGFSSDQIAYAIENRDINWNEQAARKAAFLLDNSPHTREDIITDLELTYGFTYEQAVYGADSVGL